MPTLSQIKTIQLGRRLCGLSDAQYRMLLRNVGGVDSSKELDSAGVEDVLAVMEDSGFDSHPSGPTYWRDKVRRRGHECGERAVHKIEELSRLQRYPLQRLCELFSNQRTSEPAKLTPGEAWKLIEMLKAAVARETPTPV